MWRPLFALIFVQALSVGSGYTIDSSRIGPRLDGFGAISGGGATSRLLFSYPNETSSAILDLLFLPQYGASLHHLKVEIGGDGQSSEGVEPSHLHNDDAGSVNYQRGYEWKLMTEARRRNPSILLSGLAWTWPGWVGAGTHSPWTDVNRSVTYIISWLQGAKDVHGLDLDYINADWNERGWSPVFVKALRKAMDEMGFAKMGIVCGDDSHVFACAEEAEKDPELRRAIVALGSHGPLGNLSHNELPLWNTEVHAAEPGGTDLANSFSTMFIEQNITSGTLWNIVSAYNPGLFSPDWGLFRAWWPWCGHYEQDGKLWVFAHHTQATQPGFHWLQQGAGTGSLLGNQGQYVSFLDPISNAFTLLVYKPSIGQAENATFVLQGPRLAHITSLHAVCSSVVANGHPSPDTSQYFVMQPDVHVDQQSGTFVLQIRPGEMWTVTTVAGLHRGSPMPPSPVTPFPALYHDNFETCPINQEAGYFTDMTGSFECVAAPPGSNGSIVMQQQVPVHPVAWRPEEQRPFTVFAANISWRDVDVSISVLFSKNNESAMLGARANPNDCCGRVITAEDLMPGCWLWISQQGSWALYNSIQNVTSSHTGILARGTLPARPLPGTWYPLRLVLSANRAWGYFDGLSLFSQVDIASLVPPEGFVGMGTGDWGQYVMFDDFVVFCTSC